MRFAFLFSMLSLVSFAEPPIPGGDIPFVTCGTAPETFTITTKLQTMTHEGVLTIHDMQWMMTCKMIPEALTSMEGSQKLYHCTDNNMTAPRREVEVYYAFTGQPGLEDARVIDVLETGEQKTVKSIQPCQFADRE